MEDALKGLPNSLVGILDDNIGRIESQAASRKSLALKVLVWLCNSRTPLSFTELPDVLSLDESHQRTLNAKYRPSSKAILECSQASVNLEEATQMFYLVHLAVREHLLKHELGIFGDLTSKLIAKICLHFFLDPSFDRGPPLLNEDLLEEVAGQLTFQEISYLLRQHPFYVYLSHNWGWHARDCVADHVVQSLLIRFLDSRGGVAPANQVQSFTRGRQAVYWDARET